MSWVPAFQIGIWNAWILQVLSFLIISVPSIFMSKEEKKSVNRGTESYPLNKTKKWLALSTHVVIMPLVFIYSIFLPLKLGTAWLYVGLLIIALAMVTSLITTYNYAATPLGEPVTRGIYRISRHPIYLSGFLLYAGTGIACASWIVLLFAVLWIVFFHIVVPAEERFLLEKYGDSYREYLKSTPRWIGIPKSLAK